MNGIELSVLDKYCKYSHKFFIISMLNPTSTTKFKHSLWCTFSIHKTEQKIVCRHDSDPSFSNLLETLYCRFPFHLTTIIKPFGFCITTGKFSGYCI